MLRPGRSLARTPGTGEISGRCMQDEARHVAYGTMELKSYLEHHPDPAVAEERMHRFADVGELILLSAMTDPCLLEPVAVLMGGSLAAIDEGFEGIGFLWTTVRQEGRLGRPGHLPAPHRGAHPISLSLPHRRARRVIRRERRAAGAPSGR